MIRGLGLFQVREVRVWLVCRIPVFGAVFGDFHIAGIPTAGHRRGAGRRGHRPGAEHRTAMAGSRGCLCAQRVVSDVEEAALAGAELGYPLAVKLAAGGRHKTEIGAVRVGVSDEAALRAAFVEVSAVAAVDALDDRSTPVLVQPMAPPGIEMIIGAVQHDRFGPVVMVGAGGMLGDLRTGPLLVGYSGAAMVSRDALCDLVVRAAALADGLPDVAELDLNPVICRGRDLVVVDARIRVVAAAPRPDPLLRKLE